MENWAQTYSGRFNQFFQNWDWRFCQKEKKTNISTSCSREPHVWILTLNFVLLGSLGTSFSLILQIYKPYSSGCGTFFQIPKSSGPIQKQGPISFTCILNRYGALQQIEIAKILRSSFTTNDNSSIIYNLQPTCQFFKNFHPVYLKNKILMFKIFFSKFQFWFWL